MNHLWSHFEVLENKNILENLKVSKCLFYFARGLNGLLQVATVESQIDKKKFKKKIFF